MAVRLDRKQTRRKFTPGLRDCSVSRFLSFHNVYQKPITSRYTSKTHVNWNGEILENARENQRNPGMGVARRGSAGDWYYPHRLPRNSNTAAVGVGARRTAEHQASGQSGQSEDGRTGEGGYQSQLRAR